MHFSTGLYHRYKEERLFLDRIIKNTDYLEYALLIKELDQVSVLTNAISNDIVM